MQYLSWKVSEWTMYCVPTPGSVSQTHALIESISVTCFHIRRITMVETDPKFQVPFQTESNKVLMFALHIHRYYWRYRYIFFKDIIMCGGHNTLDKTLQMNLGFLPCMCFHLWICWLPVPNIWSVKIDIYLGYDKNRMSSKQSDPSLNQSVLHQKCIYFC